MPAIKVSYVDRSGALHPDARFEVVALHLELNQGGTVAGDFKIVAYHDQLSKDAGFPPFEERPFLPMTDDIVTALQSQFTLGFYQALLQLPEFQGAEIVA